MFFDQDDIRLEVINAYKFNFSKDKDNCDARDYYMISLRTESDGSTEFTFKDKTYCLEKHDLIFIPPKNPYFRNTKNSEELIVFHFRSDNLKNNDITVIKNTNSKITNLFSEGYKTAVTQPKNYKLKLNSVMYSIMFELNRPSYRSEIVRAIDLINQNYCSHDFRISTISKELHMSESYLRKLFKQEVGISLKRFCDNLRFERAIHLLSADYLSIEEISDMVGFSDVKNFSSAFCKKYGAPPSRYKKDLT